MDDMGMTIPISLYGLQGKKIVQCSSTLGVLPQEIHVWIQRSPSPPPTHAQTPGQLSELC